MISGNPEVGFAQSVPVTAGYRDHYYGTTPDQAATGEKPQSKLWWNDGLWWGSLWDPAMNKYAIHRLDFSTQSWMSTGIAIDDRGGSKADALWDGQRLYIVSNYFVEAGAGPASSSQSGRLYRYSYNPATLNYSLDAGFPVNVNSSKSETLVLDKDSTGQLWVTWTENGKVKVNRTTGSDLSWSAPFDLPVQGGNIDSDDISSLIAFDGDKIGLMWSNQLDSRVYFAVHRDSDADNVWQASEHALSDAVLGAVADDHLNLKISGDGSGNLFAVAKTSIIGDNADKIYLLKRTVTGVWSRHLFGKGLDNHSRPIFLIDDQNEKIYVFAMSDVGGSSKIYMKSANLSNPTFVDGVGTPFIQSSTEQTINDPTSTKQNLNGTTDLVILACDTNKRYYMHNFIDLPGTVLPPPSIASFSPASGPVGIETTITGADFTGATSVKFNGTTAGDFVVVSNTLVRATVPGGATTGMITVTTSAGVATSADNFAITPSQPPAITSFSPSSGPNGTEVTISGSNFIGVSSVKFGGAPTSTFTVDSITQIRATLSSGASNGEISVTTPGGTAFSTDDFTVIPAITSTFNPVEDAYVRLSTPISNFGNVSTLRLRKTGGDDFDSFLKFDVTGLPGVVLRATLRLSIVNASTDGGAAYLVSNHFKDTTTPWDESGLNWDNAPVINGAALSSAGALNNVTWAEFDVTAAITGDGIYSFGLTSNSSDETHYSSKESSNAPELVIQAGTSSLPPPSITSFSPTSGLSGDQVTITGSNFNGAGSVKFNGVSATTFTVQSTTEIRANVPSGASSGKISVTTDGGTALSTNNFTVTTPPPAPTIASFTPPSGLTGAEVTITGSNFSGASSVKFNSLAATTFTVDSNTQIRANVPSAATTGKISVTTPGGTAQSAADFTVTTPPAAPTITSFTPSSGVVGAEVTIIGTNFTGVTSVPFNGTPASTFTVDFATQIRASVPSGASTGKISVTTAEGTALSVNNFTVNSGSSAIMTFTPQHDTYLRRSSPSTNFGSAVTLRARKTSNDDLRSYLKFEVSGLTGAVQNARLRLQVTNESSDGGTAYSVSNNYEGTATPWVENDLQWNNAPAMSGIALSTAGIVTIGQMVEFEVTAAIDGDGIYSFCLVNNSSNDVHYSSKEGVGQPQLVIQTGSGSLPAPSIASFTPTSGLAGAEVTITGANFSGASSVQFNGVSATTFTVQSAAGIRANVPSGASSGKISVTTGGGTALSAGDFTITTPPAAPTIASFTPTSGLTGAEVTITGANFSGASSVQFNGVSATTFTVQSAAEIRANVPSGASSGKISVTTDGGTALSTDDFTVTTPPAVPTIASFTPTSGLTGAEVTILGSNFSGASSVQFNGVSATTFTVQSAAEIRANVPSGASSGKISVTTDGGTALSSTNFTVSTGSAPVTLSFTPLYDTYVRLATPTSNYGTISALRLRKASGEDLDSYLKFDVVGITGAVQSATLRLKVTNASADGGAVYAVSNNFKNTTTPWTQSGMNWNNAPGMSGSVLGSAAAVAIGDIVEFDVTAAIAGNGIYSFGLSNNSSDDAQYSSQEGATQPELIIQFGTGSPAVPAISSFTPSNGAVGVQVTITGANFSGASTVQFNGAIASTFTVDSATQIRAVVPNGGSTGKISVTTAGGTALSVADFTVGASPAAPTITSFTPSSGIVGTEVTITGSNFSGASSVKFNTTTASTFTVDSATQIRATVRSGATTGKISITTAGGTVQSAADFTITGGGTVTLTFNPGEDSYVQLTTPTTNYGSNSGLRARKTSSEEQRSYLKFGLTGITGTVVSATLRLKVTNASDNGGSVFKVLNNYMGTATPWNENGIIWNNAPAVTGSPLSSVGAVSVGNVAEFNVTSAITGNSQVSFAVTSSSSNDVQFNSKEGGVNPELVIVISSPSAAREDGFADSPAEALPAEFSLSQNYPNPFNARTTIEYALPEAVQVRLAIYNSLGQLVRKLVDETQSAGYKSATWDGTDKHGRAVGSGLYFYRLDAGSHRMNGRMILQQ